MKVRKLHNSKDESSCIALFISREQQVQIGQAFRGTTQQFQEALDQVNWTPEIIEGLQQAALSGPQLTFCGGDDSVSDT